MGMTTFELAKYIKLAYTKSPVLTPKLFNQVIDLIMQIASNSSGGNIIIENPENPTNPKQLTAIEIRDALSTLIGKERLNAKYIHELAENVVLVNPHNSETVNIIQMIDYILDLLENSTPEDNQTGSGVKFLNDEGNYISIDWSYIANRITKTSELTNDGPNGSTRYVTIDELETVTKNQINIDTGILSGFKMSFSGSSVVVTPGTFAIYNYDTNKLNVYNSTSALSTAIDVSANVIYLAINSSKNLVTKIGRQFSDSERRHNAVIGRIEILNGQIVNVRPIRPNLYGPIQQLYDMMSAMGIVSTFGNEILSEAGMLLTKTAGILFGPGLNGSENYRPNSIDSLLQQNFEFTYITSNFDVLETTTAVKSTYKLLNNAFTDLSSSKFGLTKFSMTLDNKWYAEMSSSEFDSISIAKLFAMNFTSSSAIQQLSAYSFFIVYKSGITNLSVAINQGLADIFKDDGSSFNQELTYEKIISALGYVPENVENKRTTLLNPNDTTYPTTKAVADAINQINGLQTQRFDFVAQTSLTIQHTVPPPVKAFLYINNQEALANISYDETNSQVSVVLSKPKSGYIIIQSLFDS
jgi:hypothetical protein